MDLVTAGVSIVGATLSGGGVTWILTALTRRRTDRAEATARLTDAAMAQVDQLQERVHEAEQAAQEARQAAREARQEADDAQRQMALVRREAQELAERLGTLVRWVHSPDMSLDRLRVLVPAPPSSNGATG